MTDLDSAEATPWRRTLAAATDAAEELRDDGWDVTTVRAGHVAPEPPEHGDSDRYGLVYVAPDSTEAPFREAFEPGAFDTYEVFRRRDGSDLYLLTRVLDHDRRIAVVLVGAVNLAHAADLRATAAETGEMYSHVQLLDGTHLGTFEHDDPSLFFGGDE